MSVLPEAIVRVTADGEVCHATRERRDRQARRTTYAGISAKALYLGVRMLSIPLAIRLLRVDGYGLWLTVGSLVNWLGLFELGIGSGLVNALSAAYGRNDARMMRRHISTAIFAAMALTAVGIAIALGLARWDGVEQLLGVAGNAVLARDARVLVAICGTIFAFSVLTNVLAQVWLGMQRGYLGQIAFTAGTVAGLLLLAGLTIRGATVAEFALAVGAPPVIAYFVMSAHFFGWSRPDLRPGWKAASASSLRLLGGTGIFLSIAQIGDLVILCSANLLIASHLGPGQVPQYAVAYSLLMFAQSVCLHFITPLWPAYSEALVLKDRQYVRLAFWRTTRTTLLLMSAALAGFALLGRRFIAIWAGPAAVPPHAVVGALCLWFLVWTWNQNVNVAVNAFGDVRRRALGSALSAGMFLLTALVALPLAGLVAIPLAGLAGAVAEGLCNTSLAVRRLRG